MATLTIFLHGIGSSSDTWTNFINVLQSDNDTSEVKEYTPNSTELSDDRAYYYLYDYKSEILGNGSIISKVKESLSGTKVNGNITIDKHVDSLKSFISFNIEKFSIINLVAHSLGGVLTMKLLFKIKNNIEIKNKLESIIFYGVPLKGSDEPNELKKYLGKNIPTKILQELAPKSITITSLNQAIEKESIYLKNNFRILYIKGNSDDRIIEIDDTYIEKFGRVENIQGGHSEIINPVNINDNSFIYFKSFVCEHKKDNSEKKIKKTVFSIKTTDGNVLYKNNLKEIKFESSFLDFIKSADILEKSHYDKDRVTLDDIYVYPRVESYYNLKISKKSIDTKELINKFKESKLLIAGESQSGKTSLCKKFIEKLRRKGLIPVYLTADRNPYEGKIENRLIKAFKIQYTNCGYDEISPRNIVPVLDNFHLAKKKERHISDLEKYPNTILIVDDLFSLNLSQDNILREYKHYKIKEYSPTLRNLIIKKWMELSNNGASVNDTYEILDNKSELVENALGKVMGNGIMPSYPFFILTIINTFEAFEKPLDQEITSQGHCYQALIYIYLRKEKIKNEDIDTYINFLTEFAFFLYKEKLKEVSKEDFNYFIEGYKKLYNLTVKKDVLLNKLNKAQIISLDSFNNYGFNYPYLQYFFVAKYLAEHSDNNTSKLVDDLIDNLHKNENAYILSFISHHSKDDFFLNKLLSSANNLYDSYSPSTLCTKELAFFDKKINELVKAALPNGNTSPEQVRAEKLKVQDEIEEDSDLNQDIDTELENNLDYLKLRKSIKTVEVMGHIIKIRAGSLKRDKLEELFTSAMRVNLRVIREFIEIIENEETQDIILDFLKGMINGDINAKNEITKNEMDKIAVRLFWNANFFLISTLINKTIHSLGSDNLISIVNSVCDKEDTPAAFLIKHGILMWFNKNMQTDVIVKRIKEKDFSPISKRVLDFMVVNHCSLHHIKTKDIQKVENKLGIVTGQLNTPFKLIKS